MRGVKSRKRECKWEKGISKRGRRGRTNEQKEGMLQDGYGVETMVGLLASGSQMGKRRMGAREREVTKGRPCYGEQWQATK
jgi:hypothetical protein